MPLRPWPQGAEPLQVCVAPDFAETTLRRHGKSFHFASRFLDPHYARRATRLYAFSRFVDDLADEAPGPAAAREGLAQVVRELTGEAEASAPTRDFLDLARETGMSLEPVLALIDGVRYDLGEVAIQTEEELLRYAYGVAGVVGLLMCDVLDVSDPAARPFAIDLGIAMQLTNIARDVAEDAARGRRYVPETWIGPISATAILLPEPSLRPVLQSALKRLLSLADRFYASGESGLGYLPTRARFAILVAARVYRRIGHRIAQNDHATWCGRAWVSGPEKVLVASGAALSFGLHGHLHTRRRIHDARLHRALEGLPGTHAVG